MDSVYACNLRRWNEELRQLKPTPGYCILIDMVNSVALKDKGLSAWCGATCNVIAKARTWLDYDADSEDKNDEIDQSFLQQRGLLPLKIMGDCIMFYIPAKALPQGFTALSIFSSSAVSAVNGLVCQRPQC